MSIAKNALVVTPVELKEMLSDYIHKNEGRKLEAGEITVMLNLAASDLGPARHGEYLPQPLFTVTWEKK